MGKAEWGGNPVCWWLGLYFYCCCCLDEVSCTGCYWWLGDAGSGIQVLLVVGWCWVWYSSGFICVSSHYLILPRVSSLVVQGLGVSVSTPKAQSLISGQEQRFLKWFVMALSKIKTNIQKWETRDEPQTNGSYRIRQIIIKIMEYTYTPISKIKTVQEK